MLHKDNCIVSVLKDRKSIIVEGRPYNTNSSVSNHTNQMNHSVFCVQIVEPLKTYMVVYMKYFWKSFEPKEAIKPFGLFSF
jgi:hypothetical protein